MIVRFTGRFLYRLNVLKQMGDVQIQTGRVVGMIKE